MAAVSNSAGIPVTGSVTPPHAASQVTPTPLHRVRLTALDRVDRLRVFSQNCQICRLFLFLKALSSPIPSSGGCKITAAEAVARGRTAAHSWSARPLPAEHGQQKRRVSVSAPAPSHRLRASSHFSAFHACSTVSILENEGLASSGPPRSPWQKPVLCQV